MLQFHTSNTIAYFIRSNFTIFDRGINSIAVYYLKACYPLLKLSLCQRKISMP